MTRLKNPALKRMEDEYGVSFELLSKGSKNALKTWLGTDKKHSYLLQWYLAGGDRTTGYFFTHVLSKKELLEHVNHWLLDPEDTQLTIWDDKGIPRSFVITDFKLK